MSNITREDIKTPFAEMSAEQLEAGLKLWAQGGDKAVEELLARHKAEKRAVKDGKTTA